MTPILYKKTATKAETEKTNGLGFLTECVKCEIIEERNGAFTATLQYPTTGRLYSQIEHDAIIKARASDNGNPQLFRIYKIGITINGITTYYAEHISYDLKNLPLNGLTVNNMTAQAAMQRAFNMCPVLHEFTAYSDITTPNSTTIETPLGLRSILGGTAGSILDTWGGEYEFDNYAVHLWAHRGKNNGVILRYGKNLTDFKQEENIAECYTHIFPYAMREVSTENDDGSAGEQQTEKITLSEQIVALPPMVVGHTRVLMLDLSSEFSAEEEYSEDALRKKAEAYITAHDLTAPAVNISVSFVALWQTEEYKEIAPLERVKLCDTVNVYFEKLGVQASAKVIKTVYDTIKERYSSIELGSAKSNFADTVKEISQSIASVKAAAENTYSRLVVEADRITAEVSRAKQSEFQITSLITQSADEILMSVSETYAKQEDGQTQSFAYSLKSSGATFTANGKTVLEITKDGLNLTGRIVATAGEIGGCTIENGVLKITDANITALSVSHLSGGEKGHFALDDEGNITASGGTIGGFTITETSIYNGIDSIEAEGNGVYVGNDGIDVGGGFIVDKAGNVRIKKGIIKLGGVQDGWTSSSTYNDAGFYSSFSYGEGVYQDTASCTIGRNGILLSSKYGTSGQTSGQRLSINSNSSYRGYEILAERSLRLAAMDSSDQLAAWIHIIDNPDTWTGTMTLYANSGELQGTWTLDSGEAITSDANQKNSVEDLGDAYSLMFDALRPCRFKYNDGSSGRYHTGFIAQEVEEAILGAGLSTNEAAVFERNEKGICALRYSEIIALCVKEIQSLKKKLAEGEKVEA